MFYNSVISLPLAKFLTSLYVKISRGITNNKFPTFCRKCKLDFEIFIDTQTVWANKNQMLYKHHRKFLSQPVYKYSNTGPNITQFYIR